MKVKLTFFKNNVSSNTSGYIGTYDQQIVFAHQSLVGIIDSYALERIPIDVFLRVSRTGNSQISSFIAFPEWHTAYDQFKPKTSFAGQSFKVYVDSQNFCISLNNLSRVLAPAQKRFGQRLSACKVFDAINNVFPIEMINFYRSYNSNNSFIHYQDLNIILTNNRYNLITLKRPVNKTDLDAPIIDEIYELTTTSETGGLLVLTGDGDYSFAIKTWLKRDPSRVAACVAIKQTISPELVEMTNLERFDMLQLGSDSTFFDGCWV